MKLIDIPKDPTYIIASKLDIITLSNLCLTNIKLSSICNDDKFWLLKLTIDYPNDLNFKPEVLPWKVYYRDILTLEILTNIMNLFSFSLFTENFEQMILSIARFQGLTTEHLIVQTEFAFNIFSARQLNKKLLGLIGLNKLRAVVDKGKLAKCAKAKKCFQLKRSPGYKILYLPDNSVIHSMNLKAYLRSITFFLKTNNLFDLLGFDRMVDLENLVPESYKP